MPTLPITNVVNVAISRETQFPTAPGFGTMMIVCPDTQAGSVLGLGNRVGTYSSISAVAAEFASTTEAYKAALAYFSQNPRPTQLKIGVRDATPSGTFADEMNLISAADDDWYAFILTGEARVSDDAASYAAAAAWAEARTKLFVTATNEAAALSGGGGIPLILKTSNYDRTAVFYHQDADLAVVAPQTPYPEAAFLGRMLTVDFNGSNTTKTGKFKTLSGIVSSPLTDSQFDFLVGNNGNAYVSIANTPMTANGVMASGEFFDVMHGVDWLQAEIAFRVFGMLATLPKVPYTDQGMEILINQVRLALRQAVANGLVAADFDDEGNLREAFEVSAPSVLSMSNANRAARIAPTITFTARLAGAVHFAQINGTVTV